MSKVIMKKGVQTEKQIGNAMNQAKAVDTSMQVTS